MIVAGDVCPDRFGPTMASGTGADREMSVWATPWSKRDRLVNAPTIIDLPGV